MRVEISFISLIKIVTLYIYISAIYQLLLKRNCFSTESTFFITSRLCCDQWIEIDLKVGGGGGVARLKVWILWQRRRQKQKILTFRTHTHKHMLNKWELKWHNLAMDWARGNDLMDVLTWLTWWDINCFIFNAQIILWKY